MLWKILLDDIYKYIYVYIWKCLENIFGSNVYDITYTRAYSSRTFASLENWWGLKMVWRVYIAKDFFFFYADKIAQVTLNM